MCNLVNFDSIPFAKYRNLKKDFFFFWYSLCAGDVGHYYYYYFHVLELEGCSAEPLDSLSVVS